jgi:hypothetical protein
LGEQRQRHTSRQEASTVAAMKSAPAPVPIRCGGLVRTEAGGPLDAGARTLVLSFVDLRFDDGHVERWLGPGSLAGFPSGDGALQRLNQWAEDASEPTPGSRARCRPKQRSDHQVARPRCVPTGYRPWRRPHTRSTTAPPPPPPTARLSASAAAARP